MVVVEVVIDADMDKCNSVWYPIFGEKEVEKPSAFTSVGIVVGDIIL